MPWRPLPETSSRWFHSAEARIARDGLGVPTPAARTSQQDAIFLEGYAMAQDRLWQMDAMRRSQAGELAEIAGHPRWSPIRKLAG